MSLIHNDLLIVEECPGVLTAFDVKTGITLNRFPFFFSFNLIITCN